MADGLGASAVRRAACGLCGSATVRRVVTFSSLTVARCGVCRAGLVVQQGITSEQPLGALDEKSRKYESELDRGKAAACWDLVRRYTCQLRGIRSILDVGCGQGHFLDLAKRAGLRTAGIEIGPQAASVAAAKGHEVVCGSALTAPLPPGRFDAAVMWDVLEHMEQPGCVLRRVVGALAPRGRLFILTPMVDSVYDRLGVSLYLATGGNFDRLLRMCWSRDHLFRYDGRGLCRTLRSLGCGAARARSVLLLSMGETAYAGGALAGEWTPRPALNRAISRWGVRSARLLRLHNKVLVEARRRAT